MKLTIVILLLVVLGVIAYTASCSRSQPSKPHDEIIREALARLLERPSGAFVIIEEPKSGKFIQFAGSINESLLLDLPTQTLSAEEFEKAKSVFDEFGYSGPKTIQLQEYPGGPPAGEYTSFMAKFGRDVDRATQFSVVVLYQVYGLTDRTRLKLTEE